MARAAKSPVALIEPEASGGVLETLTMATRHIALLTAMIATCGSLFFSEILNWIPCQLCWYQRILMYPLTVILAVGIVRNDRGVYLYGLPLSLSGMGVALYHYLQVLKIIPPAACQGGVDCSIDYLTPILTGPWSFVKIPFLALVCFAIISVMLGNYALAGAPRTPVAARRASTIAVIVIVVTTIVVFWGLGALI
ncbi:MAG: disulfide bond formation protein B [Oscillochloridaceae bacterium umkhey_bin13]